MHNATKISIFDMPYFLLILMCCSFTAGAQNTILNKEKKRPNIIFILTDDQRFDALGYQGNELIHTPEMDKLAASGTYFKNALVTTPICTASRASILTGLQERAHRFNFQTGNIREEYMQNSYPRLLKESGYHTAFFGKYGIRYDEEDKLFDTYETYDRNNAYPDRRGYYYKTIGKDTVHLTRYTGQQALDFIDNIATEKPFCLQLSFSAPHAHDSAEEQYFWQQETNSLLENTTMPGPALGEDKYFNEQPEMVKAGFNRLRWTWRFDTPQKYQHSVKGYYRMISGIDLEIEKIRKQLAAKGLAENTIIIIMGDNGYFLGERQFAGKWLMYDNSLRVPLIIYDPRVNKHQDIEAMALNTDVPATILDFAGVRRPSTWQGKSLKPIVDGEAITMNRDTVLIEHIWDFEQIPPSEGVRTNEWKYFRYVNDQSIEELYHLKKDPYEIQNLAKNRKYEGILQKLRAKTEALIAQNSDSYSNPPYGLTVEFIRNTESVFIVDDTPEYSWVVPKESVSQSGYQILVSSSKEKSTANIGDVWNSGQVRGNVSSNITHQGKPLEKGKAYFWKVRVWDEDNRLVDYSEVQSFTMHSNINSGTTQNSFQIDSIPPSVFKRTGDASYFIDFKKAAFATLSFRYTTKENDTLLVHIGEQLENGKINRNPKGNIRYQKIKVPVSPSQTAYTLNIAPNARNTKIGAVALPNSFPVLMPFRYAEIENVKTELVSNDIIQLAYHGYWEENQSYFESSDTILNDVWDLCKYTIKATSFAGIYVDGDRERIPYEADAYLNQLSHYTTDQEYAIARETIAYFMDHPTWPTEWQLHVALMVHADYMYTGNIELITKYYEQLKTKSLEGLRREDGLISSTAATPELMKKLGFKNPDDTLKDIVDWPPAQKDTNWELATEEGERDGFVFTPVNTVVNAFHYKNMELMSQFAEILNKTEEAADFQAKALQTKQAINSKLFDTEHKIYTDGEGTNHASLHANMMVLAFGIVPKVYEKSVAEHVKSRGMACSVYGSQYLLEALYNAGESEYALDLMTATTDRSWYNMIKIGATMTLEAWDMKYKPNADWNHAWGATPANIITRNLWGIQPKEAGYTIAVIRPQLGSLKNASIKVPTIKGVITANYEYVTARKQVYTIDLPANMVAEFEVKPGGEKVLLLNGKKVSTAFGTIRLTPGINVIELVINSF